MGILDTLSSFRAPLTLLLVIFGPSLLPRIFNLIRRRNNPTTPITPSEPLSTILKAFLALNTIYSLVHLYYPPYDLFTSARLPILAPNAVVRRAVLATSPASPGVTLADSSASNPVIELLLQRLQNADHRINYARFGHGPLTQCVWCTSSDDFLLYSLPDIISTYAYAAVFLGVISSQAVGGEGAGKRAEKWRNTVGLGIGGFCLADLAARYLWDLRPVQGDCLHVSNALLLLTMRLTPSYRAQSIHFEVSRSSLSPWYTLTYPYLRLQKTYPPSSPGLLSRSK